MTATKFSEKNKEYSDRAHEAARALIYPSFFCRDPEDIHWREQAPINKSKLWEALDGMMAIDRMPSVIANGMKAPVTFPFQERFRKPAYARYQDITITEWNNASNLPSEASKLMCGFFLYAYFHEGWNDFVDAIIVNTSDVLYAIAIGEVRVSERKENKRSDQSFITLTFKDLGDAGLIKWRQSDHEARIERVNSEETREHKERMETIRREDAEAGRGIPGRS